jgi:hypothetical protein
LIGSNLKLLESVKKRGLIYEKLAKMELTPLNAIAAVLVVGIVVFMIVTRRPKNSPPVVSVGLPVFS